MTSREGKELRARVEALETRVLQLAGQPATVHHHHHYPPPDYPPAYLASYAGQTWKQIQNQSTSVVSAGTGQLLNLTVGVS